MHHFFILLHAKAPRNVTPATTAPPTPKVATIPFAARDCTLAKREPATTLPMEDCSPAAAEPAAMPEEVKPRLETAVKTAAIVTPTAAIVAVKAILRRFMFDNGYSKS